MIRRADDPGGHLKPAAALLGALVLGLLSSAPAATGTPRAGASTSTAAALGPAAPARAAPRGSVVAVGVPGLRWDDLSATGTPVLWRLAGQGSIGALSVRAARSVTCPADGWVTLGAGNRARALEDMSLGCAGPPPDIVRVNADGGADVPAMPAIVRANERSSARPGRLGDAAGCISAVGPGAALAAADHKGHLSHYAAQLPDDPRPLLSSCPVTVLALAQLESPGSRRTHLRQLDRQIDTIDRLRVNGSQLLIVGLSETGDPRPHLHVAISVGPEDNSGWIRSASTRRTPYVQLVDVAPTVLDTIGAAPDQAMIGEPFRPAGGRPAELASAVDHLVDADRAAVAAARLVPPFFVFLVAGQLVLYGLSVLALRRVRRRQLAGAARIRRITSTVALAAAAAMIATYLANLVPWWRAPAQLAALLGCVLAWTAVVTVVALAGPWRRWALGPTGVVVAVIAGALGIDVVTGAHLQLDSLAGYSPLVAGRFAGFGNVAFAVFGTAALLFAAVLTAGRSRRRTLITVTVVGVLAVVADGAPPFGSDFGGVLALIPSFALLGMLCAGIRVSWLRLLLVGAAAVLVVGSIAVLDHLRPADDQSHLGRFVGAVLDGTAGGVVAGKAGANWQLLTHSVLTLFVPVAVVFVAYALLRPAGQLSRAFAAAPNLRHGLVCVLVLSLLGFAVNDSGIAVPALAMTVAIPLAIAVSLRVQDWPACQPSVVDGGSAPAPATEVG